MRFFIYRDTPEFWIAAAALGVLLIGFAIFRTIRPPLVERLNGEACYREALGIYASNLPSAEPTRDERQAAMAPAIELLVKVHGVPPDEAGKNLRALVAAADRELSYELRHEALAYERAGAYDLALDYFQRAARLQEEHDPKDHQFLLRCIARVQGQARKR